jgi:zinc transport system substrate-binding protein
MPLLRTPALVLAGAVGLAACGGGQSASPEDRAEGGTGERLAVAAAFYPLEFVARRVGGDRVDLEALTPPGAEPHDLELGARQTARIADADLLLHLSGFQPAVDEAAEQVRDRALDAATVVELRAGFEELDHEDEEGEGHAGEAHAGDQRDPHVWLDPTLLSAIAEAVATRLAELDPSAAADYRSRADALRTELEQLDAEFRAGLASCERTDVVVSHNAFGYLAARYGLQQVGISGLSPEEEPSPARVADAARYARENGVTTIFFETLVSPAVAETVASEVGARTAVLDPIEGPPDSGDYLTAMRANLTELRAALACG